MADQLRIFNSMLLIRPDHKHATEPFEYVSEAGDEFTIFDGNIIPKNKDERRPHFQMTFGGPEGLRAAGYIALTFAAHSFPQLSRSESFKRFIEYVQNGGENDYVWWEDGANLDKIPRNPFRFGHTVAIATSSQLSCVDVLISLFGSLNYGVRIPVQDAVADRTVIAYIDPEGELPNDYHSSSIPNRVLILRKPSPLHAYLQKMITDGASQHALQDLMNRIARWKFDRDMAPYVRELNRARGLSGAKLFAAVKSLFEMEATRVLRLMIFATNEFAKQQGGKSHLDEVISAMRRMTEADVDSVTGLTEFATQSLESVILAMMREVGEALASRDIDLDCLWSIFSSGPGVALVAETMFAPILRAFNDAANDD